VVTPLGPALTEIRLDGNADPGGRIPVWIANTVVTLMPRDTLYKLRARLHTPGKVSTALLGSDPRVVKLLANVKFPE